MTDPEHPEPDRVEGAPHPRDTARLFGQRAAEAAFVDAYATGRLHHGWLLTGPRGIGKATLAWRMARFLLTTPPDDGAGPSLFGDPAPAPATLDTPSDHPVNRRIQAGAEPRLFVLRRAWDDEKKRLKSVISVDEVRRLKSFFQLSAADGGQRVAIVDDADEMNPPAANALLKLLEEPPAAVTLLLISHQPSGLLPTIRSRCRELRLATLAPDDLALALSQAEVEATDPAALGALSGGSAGAAIRVANLDGLALYGMIITLFTGLPRLDRPTALRLAETGAARGQEARFDLILSLLDLFLARLARSGVSGPPVPEAAAGEAALFARLAPDLGAARVWAQLQQTLGARARKGRAVNLDPVALLLDMILKIDQTAGELAPR
jgi:DNA polymerase III subunit delta'